MALTEQPRSTLYSYFQTGDRPTEQQFKELIDSFLNKKDDNLTSVNGTIGIRIGTKTPKKHLDVFGHMHLSDDNNAGVFYFPEEGIAPGLYFRSLQNDNGHTDRLHISGKTGNVGIGITNASYLLHIKNPDQKGAWLMVESNEEHSRLSLKTKNQEWVIYNNYDESGHGWETLQFRSELGKTNVLSLGANGGGTLRGNFTIESTGVPLRFIETKDAKGNQPEVDKGRHWRMPLDDGGLRFDVNINPDESKAFWDIDPDKKTKGYRTPLYLYPDGSTVWLGRGHKTTLTVNGDICLGKRVDNGVWYEEDFLINTRFENDADYLSIIPREKDPGENKKLDWLINRGLRVYRNGQVKLFADELNNDLAKTSLNFQNKKDQTSFWVTGINGGKFTLYWKDSNGKIYKSELVGTEVK